MRKIIAVRCYPLWQHLVCRIIICIIVLFNHAM
jgi:hypothetical protein